MRRGQVHEHIAQHTIGLALGAPGSARGHTASWRSRPRTPTREPWPPGPRVCRAQRVQGVRCMSTCLMCPTCPRCPRHGVSDVSNVPGVNPRPALRMRHTLQGAPPCAVQRATGSSPRTGINRRRVNPNPKPVAPVRLVLQRECAVTEGRPRAQGENGVTGCNVANVRGRGRTAADTSNGQRAARQASAYHRLDVRRPRGPVCTGARRIGRGAHSGERCHRGDGVGARDACDRVRCLPRSTWPSTPWLRSMPSGLASTFSFSPTRPRRATRSTDIRATGRLACFALRHRTRSRCKSFGIGGSVSTM